MDADVGRESVGPQQKPFFKELTAEGIEDHGPMEMESLCMECERNGITRLLLTKIPMFKEVVVSSFHCPHCGASNSGIQSGAAIEPKGVKYRFNVQEPEHLNRLIVKADTATVYIPELNFEIPPSNNNGSVTTVENILLQAAEGLEKEQPIRKALNPDLATKLDMFIQRLKDCMQLKRQFMLVVDDPTGNSFVENKSAPQVDPCLHVEHYSRSEQQDKQLGAIITTQSKVSSATADDAEDGPVGNDESETSVLYVPSLDFECSHSSTGGRFTTVEGMLTEVRTQLGRANPFLGDSVPQSQLATFLEKLSEIINGEKLGVDVVLNDPAGNSFIQNVCAPDPDPNLTVVHYERTFEQNDQLGLNDMKTENYVDND